MAEVDALGDAVTGEAAEENEIFVFAVGVKDGNEVFCKQDRAAPAMRDANFAKGRVEIADALFENF